MRVLLLLGITCLSVFAEEPTSKKDLSNGFRTEIDWVKWDNAIGVAKDLNKPIFFLIHKTWCGACSGLKREFKTSPKMSELIELSKKFVMVNVEDDEEPEDDKYAPDGGYIPRILFLDTDAEPMKTNNEAKYRNNKYFYPLVPQVVDGMQRALAEFEAKSTESSDKPKKDIEKDDSSDAKSKKTSKVEKEETKKSTKKEEEKKSSKKEETKKDSKKDDEKKSSKKEETRKDSKKDDEKKAAKKEDAKKSTKDRKTKETDKKEKEKSDKKDKKSDKKEKKSDKKDEKKKEDASDKENKENKAKDTKKKSKSDDKKTESKDGKKKDAKAKKQEL